MNYQMGFDSDDQGDVTTRHVPSKLTEDAMSWGAEVVQTDLELWARDNEQREDVEATA